MTGREVVLEKQVRDLQAQVHGLSSLVADKLKQLDERDALLDDARETLRRVYRECEWTEDDFADEGKAWQVRAFLARFAADKDNP